MNKFKVGDKVRISDYGYKCLSETSWFDLFLRGTIGIDTYTIDEIIGNRCYLKEDMKVFTWYEEWLEKVEGPEEPEEDSCKVEVCGVTISGDTEAVKKFLLDMAVLSSKADDAYTIQKLNNLAKEARDCFRTFYTEFERLENGI